jgi:hypothetical protein
MVARLPSTLLAVSRQTIVIYSTRDLLAENSKSRKAKQTITLKK